MTAKEMFEQYAARSGTTVEELQARGLVVRPCACPFPNCPKWAIVHKDRAAEHDMLYGPDPVSPLNRGEENEP